MQAVHTAPADMKGGHQHQNLQPGGKDNEELIRPPRMACGKVCLPAVAFWCHLCCVDDSLPASCAAVPNSFFGCIPLGRTCVFGCLQQHWPCSRSCQGCHCGWTDFMCPSCSLFNYCMAPCSGFSQPSMLSHSCLACNLGIAAVLVEAIMFLYSTKVSFITIR